MALNEAALVFAGLYVGWSIGANDASNAIGPSVGSGLISYKKAVFLFAFFCLLGAVLQGGRVLQTVGKGVVPTPIGMMDILLVMVVSASLVTLATKKGISVSTSQAIVGSLIGAAVANGSTPDWELVLKIAETWLVLPIAAAILTVIVHQLAKREMRKIRNMYEVERKLKTLLIIGSCYISFSVGANHAGTAMGPLLNSGTSLGIATLSFLGGFAIALGAMTYGKNVTATVGRGITPLDPLSAFSIQLSSSLGIHLFTILGMPVSTSHSVIGSVMGIGLSNGIRTVKKRKLASTLIGWVLTPTLAFIIVFFIHGFIA